MSVIIVAYRSAAEIGDCLRSIPSNIDGCAVEVVVVDNSPGDGAGAIVTGQFPAVRYVPVAENLGFGRANNRGRVLATGRNLLYLNPDTICNAGALSKCLARLSEDPTIGLISPRLELADGSMDLACRRSIPNLWDGFCRAAGLAGRFPEVRLFSGYNLTYLPRDGTYDVGAINGAFMMMPRAVADKVGGFDEAFFMYGDDLDLCIRTARGGYRIVYDGSVAIVHLKGLSVAKEYERMSRAIFDANRDVYLKHFNPTGSTFVRLKYRLAFGLWKRLGGLRARLRGHRSVRPV